MTSESLNPVLWQPSQEHILQSHTYAFMHKVAKDLGLSFKDYNDLYRWSVEDVASFWENIWDYTHVIGEGEKRSIIKDSEDIEKAHFFPKAHLNFAENLLRRRDHGTAIEFFCEDKLHRTLTFFDLYQQVSSLTQFLETIGVKAEDRVGCYLPNVPEAITGMLATATLGAIWSTCSPDFGVPALVDRFGQIQPKVLFITDGYFYNGKVFDVASKLPEILEKIPSIEHVILIKYAGIEVTPKVTQSVKIHAYEEILKIPAKAIVFKRFPFNHPLYILFSSGTTGVPKCIVHGAGGTLLQHLKEHQLHCDIKRDDKIFYFTTCSWMMWHWLVTCLASEASIILYDGAPTYPSIDILWKIAEKTKLKLFGTSAKYLDNLHKNHVEVGKTYDLSHLRVITSTGSPLMPTTFDYVYEHIKQDVCLASISGGTDIISCFVLGNPITPVYRGEIQAAGLGMAVEVFDDSGNAIQNESRGELVCLKPFPSQPVSFWNDPEGEKYHKAYFAKYSGIWHHGDFIAKTPHRGFVIYGRSDAVLNPGGVRIGTAEIYRQVEAIEEVVEALAVGQPFEGDERVVLFVRLQPDIMLDDTLVDRIKKQIRANTTPRHVPAKIIQVPDIPRTKNNKIAELAVKQVITGHQIENTGALLNPEILAFYQNLSELKA